MLAKEIKNMARLIKNSWAIHYPGPHGWNSFDEDDGTESKDGVGSVKNPEAPI